MYIEKFDCIGDTDDCLTLVDYFYDKGKNELPLSEIFADTGLGRLNWDFHTSPDLEYANSKGWCCEFHYAIDVVTYLAALLLETKKSGWFNLKDQFGGDHRELFVKITATPEEDQALDRVLADFCTIFTGGSSDSTYYYVKLK